MNERIKQLAEQAGFEKQTHLIDSWECGLKELERFAELVRQDEREACAKLCDAECNKEAPMKIISTFESGCYVTADYLANEIRSRK